MTNPISRRTSLNSLSKLSSRSRSSSIVWLFFGCMVTVLSAELFALYIFDFNAVGVAGKWRFMQPTFVSLTYFLMFLLIAIMALSLLTYFIGNLRVRPEKLRDKSNACQKITILILCTSYWFLNEWWVGGNYREDSSAIHKLVMGPLYTFGYSFLLLFILERCKHKFFTLIDHLLIVSCLVALFLSITGVGSLIISVSLLIFYFVVRGPSRESMVKIAMYGFLLFVGITSYLINIKYEVDFNGYTTAEKMVVVAYLAEWIAQRLLVVTGSSVYLIETFYNDPNGFGFGNVIELARQNLGKLFGEAAASSGQFKSLGMYNFSLFYSGSGEEMYGTSPGILGGSLHLVNWYLGPLLAAVMSVVILLLCATSWRSAIAPLPTPFIIFFYIAFVNWFFFNPYAYFSLIDPSFIRFLIFLGAPALYRALGRLSFGPILKH